MHDLKSPTLRGKAVRKLKDLLLEKGKLVSHEMVTEFVPMNDFLLDLWLDGYYSQVVTYIMRHKRTKGKVESIRLVIGGRAARRTINLEQADYEVYAQNFTEEYGETAVEAIDGFLLRIRRKIK